MSAVTYRLQDAHKDVVHDKPQRAHKINAEIGYRLRQNIRRCIHPDQNLRCQKNAEHR